MSDLFYELSTKCKHHLLVSALLFLGALGLPAQGHTQTLTLQQYLDQVRKQNQAYTGSSLLRESLKMRTAEGDLLFTPFAFSEIKHTSDQRETMIPAQQGKETILNTYTLGFGQRNQWGLEYKLSYNVAFNSIRGTSPGVLPHSSHYLTGPVLEFSLPLWKNRLGRDLRTQREMLLSQAALEDHGEAFKLQTLLSQAELAYWRLSLSRDLVRVQKNILERAEKIQSWASRRGELQLADRTDLLQSQAAVAGRKLEWQAAINEERAAARLFNSLRGEDRDQVAEDLEDPKVDGQAIAWQNMKIPGERADLKAARELKNLTALKSQSGKEKYRPDLSVFANFTLNGKDHEFSDSMGESLSFDHSTRAIGVRLNMPLDFASIFRYQSGLDKEALSSELQYQRKQFEHDREWNDLQEKLREALNRLRLAQELESLQREKIQHERERHSLGRTTTYQVLMFEQDFATAQLLRLRTQGEILSLISQMKTYGGSL